MSILSGPAARRLLRPPLFGQAAFRKAASSSSPSSLPSSASSWSIRHYSWLRVAWQGGGLAPVAGRTHRRCPCRRSLSAAARRTFHSADDDTIYALSSAPGKAGIAVIRVSGPACLEIYKALCPAAPALRPRYAAVRTLYDPEAGGSSRRDQAVLDASALVLYFPGPKTVTGQDVLELHVHGGPATVRAVLGALGRCGRGVSAASGLAPSPSSALSPRYAEPGEFTRRAFLHNRLDLAQVEALGDTLDAETEQQRRAAVGGHSGQLGRTYEAWRAQLLGARAELEALIDFAEDQHFDESPAELLAGVAGQVRGLLGALAVHEAAGDRGSLLRHGIRLALVGPANAGKSSLMNMVVGREASIVSHEAGTTRDIVEASLDIRGYLCTFADTAGFRGGEEGGDKTGVPQHPGDLASPLGAIEAEGIRRARQKAADSDVVIAVASIERGDSGGGGGSGSDGGSDGDGSTTTPQGPLCVRFDAETLRLAAHARQRLVVINKCDLAPDAATLAVLVQDFYATALSLVRKSWASDAAAASPAASTASTLPLALVSCRQAEEAARGQQQQHSVVSADPGGIRGFVDELARGFAHMTGLPPDAQHLLGVTARQQQLLAQCRGHLEDFLAEASLGAATAAAATATLDDSLAWNDPREADIVLAAEHLRYAADALAKITGRGDADEIEDVLGVIFEKFCVGK